MNMKKRLGEYIQEYSVRNKDDEEIPVYSVTNTLGFCRDYFGKEVASKDKTTYKIVPRGGFAYNPSRINVWFQLNCSYSLLISSVIRMYIPLLMKRIKEKS